MGIKHWSSHCTLNCLTHWNVSPVGHEHSLNNCADEFHLTVDTQAKTNQGIIGKYCFLLKVFLLFFFFLRQSRHAFRLTLNSGLFASISCILRSQVRQPDFSFLLCTYMGFCAQTWLGLELGVLSRSFLYRDRCHAQTLLYWQPPRRRGPLVSASPALSWTQSTAGGTAQALMLL